MATTGRRYDKTMEPIGLRLFNKKSDNIFSQFYGLGSEGFPYFLLRYRHLSGSPLKEIS